MQRVYLNRGATATAGTRFAQEDWINQDIGRGSGSATTGTRPSWFQAASIIRPECPSALTPSNLRCFVHKARTMPRHFHNKFGWALSGVDLANYAGALQPYPKPGADAARPRSFRSLRVFGEGNRAFP